MRPYAPVSLLLLLAACDRPEAPRHAALFLDPGAVDLSVDSPDEAFRRVQVTLANVGDGDATDLAWVLEGVHADLVVLTPPDDAEVAAGVVHHAIVRLHSAGDPALAPFVDTLTLRVTARDVDGGELSAEIPVTVGTLKTCDLDLDGEYAVACGGLDCDDHSPIVNTAQIEMCNDRDDDCDGVVDEEDAADAAPWWPDFDGDTYGADGPFVMACVAPPLFVAQDGDCDDANTAVSPLGAEFCNGLDDDCDGAADEDASDARPFYADADRDGFGDLSTPTAACEAPLGYVEDATDCDDLAASVFPTADEVCDGADNDCDGAADEEAIDAPSWYLDADLDGHGLLTERLSGCQAPAGHVPLGDDCDDTQATIAPGLPEVCDGVDQDCDGAADEDLPLVSWYADGDGDGYGAGPPASACGPLPGQVADATDCDDATEAVHPGAPEVCDGADQDCDGVADDGAPGTQAWHPDADRDGFGDPDTSVVSCQAPAGHIADGTDCDDTDDAVSPDAAEQCNGVDDDCDGTVDIGLGATWYLDLDGDGFGDAATAFQACEAPAGAVADDTDCDDADKAVFPGAPEQCNGADDDCDGAIDDGIVLTDGTSIDGGDCDDADLNVFPGAPEQCNGADDDCDGVIDNDVVMTDWYTDADGDTYGDPALGVQACEAPSDAVADDTDCDDTKASVHPDAPEQCNLIDDDCDGAVDDNVVFSDWYPDVDRDGYGNKNRPLNACVQPSGTVADGTDCNDGNAAVNPGAPEVCNRKDDDCDGAIDDGVATSTWYADADRDGYGNPNRSSVACGQPLGTVADKTDCDDADAAVHPAALEVCNLVDDDCDAQIDEGTAPSTWYADVDGDGYGDPGAPIDACGQPGGTVADDSDCDDFDSTVNPEALDSCVDGRDRNCDGVTDGCDGCHAFEPVDAAGWTRRYRVTYHGNNGTEVQTAIGSAPTDVGVGWAFRDQLNAGPYSWDVTSYTACDAAGALLQVGSEGLFTDPTIGSISLSGVDRPARVVLPAAGSFGSGGSCTFDYLLELDVNGFGRVDLPTRGGATDRGLESVTVPAGTFVAWRIDSAWTQDNTTWGGALDSRRSSFWYAEGVGLVREITTDANGAPILRKELQSYTGLTPAL